jgi:hypothetical protein
LPLQGPEDDVVGCFGWGVRTGLFAAHAADIGGVGRGRLFSSR